MKNKKLAALLCAFMVLILVLFTGCSAIGKLFDKTPENFTEGIDYNNDYEDDVLEIYDGAVVFEELAAFGENILFCGSGDDFDDIVDFYKEFFEENEISLLEETEDRDEYYARGAFEGYEFKLKVTEPEGEYVEELFENIVTLSTRELKEGEQLEATPTPAPAEPTPAPDQTDRPTDTLERPPNDANETRLAKLDPGSWVYEAYLNATDEGSSIDWTIYINDASTGTMYYSDYVGGERWWADFTYEINDGLLSIYFSDGDKWDFFAYYDYETLHLVPAYDFSNEYYLGNHGPAEQTTSFTAYGDWMAYHPEDGFISTIAFWPDGTGYVYNWYGDESDMYFTWENADGTITYWDEMGYEIDSFNFVQKYNILEYYSTYSPDEPYFYNRTDLNLLIGAYTLSQSNDPGLLGWELELYQDYTAYAKIQNANGTTEDTDAYWYVDYYEGNLWIYMDDNYYSFDYHHFVRGLLLWDAANEYYYEFTTVE